MYSDISFPDKTILEVTFLKATDFYSIYFENSNYIIVGGDKELPTNLIGISEDNKVYYITTDDKQLCYIAVNIDTFIKELLLFDDYINTNNLPENPDEMQLAEFAGNLRTKILESDADAFYDGSTFWSEICEEVEYGIIIWQ